ncbi:Josephin-1 [Sparganum proliferum]
MDEICSRLTPTWFANPHRNIFGLGNFDVNVLILALQDHDYDVVWFNRQKSMTEHNLNWDLITGFILNTRRKFLAPIPLTSRHWIAFRGFPSAEGGDILYYDLDSKLPSPLLVAKSHAEFATYIEKRLNWSPSSQLLIVAPRDVVSDRTWTLTKTG